METKFTKEEWLREGRLIYALIQTGQNKGNPVMTNKFTCFIQGATKLISDEEKEANAKLIAAAPDLLQSLYQILSLYEQLAVALPLIIKEEWYNKAKEAIKKATE